MTFAEFHNALRIMRSIDQWELAPAGVEMDAQQWRRFRENPYVWFMHASDDDARKVWAIIEARQPKAREVTP